MLWRPARGEMPELRDEPAPGGTLRAEETQILEAALARAQGGNAQIVGIVSEAGLGKSGLGYEFLEGSRARGLMTYDAHALARARRAVRRAHMDRYQRTREGSVQCTE